VSWDVDRTSAALRLYNVLRHIEIAGLVTNLEFLQKVIAHKEFIAGKCDTGFIERHKAQLIPAADKAIPEIIYALAAGYEIAKLSRGLNPSIRPQQEWVSPWDQITGWRVGGIGQASCYYKIGNQKTEILAEFLPGELKLTLPNSTVTGKVDLATDQTISIASDEGLFRARVIEEGHNLHLFHDGEHYMIERDITGLTGVSGDHGSGHLRAPMPGKVIQVLVKPQQKVDKGQPLMVLEAMKMEHTIKAGAAGVVGEIFFKVGEQVNEGSELINIEPIAA
jgi:3-methylcrotonyl-CoA carboxylase alpha subunit